MKICSSLLLLTVLSANSFGQASFDAAASDIGLLQYPDIRAELKISQAQRDKMNNAAARYNLIADRIEADLKKKKEPSEADKKALEAERPRMMKAVLANLSAAQIRRLREISLQQVGLTALTEPFIAKKIGLSKTQSSKILATFTSSDKKAKALEDSVIKKVRNIYKDKKPKDKAEEQRLRTEISDRMRKEMEAVRPQFEKILKEGRDTIFKTLTEAQRTTWNNLLGKPFVLK